MYLKTVLQVCKYYQSSYNKNTWKNYIYQYKLISLIMLSILLTELTL